MDTKQRIIEEAIASYNRYGVMNVTSRALAKSLGMSHGNLEYHFPNKEEILKAIYDQMRIELATVYEPADSEGEPLRHFSALLDRLEAFQEKYSFFNLDVLEISRNFSQIEELLKRTFELRKQQTAAFFRAFKEHGYFRDEIHPGMYMRLQHTVRVLITFWKSQEEILPSFNVNNKEGMAAHIWDLLLPHMTRKGLEACRPILPDVCNLMET